MNNTISNTTGLMNLNEAAQAVFGQLVPGTMKDAMIGSVEIDSRKIKENALFIPIVGERVDGHDFITKAFELGAVCALCNFDHKKDAPQIPEGKAILYVEDTEYALERLAEYYRSTFDIPVVGVTGSVGKTSCKDFVTAALSAEQQVLKTVGNHNNNIGMPLTLFELTKDTDMAVMEMGMDHFGEIHRLSRTARPKVGVITNIGISHMENLGSREGIRQAKLEIVDYMDPEGILFVNGDDERLQNLNGEIAQKVETFGKNASCDGRILKAELNEMGQLVFAGQYHGETYEAVLNTPGIHMAYNVMPAIMTGVFLGLTKEAIIRGLENYVGADGRLNITKTDACTVIDDCYNASPDSMKAAIDTLCLLPGDGRRVAVLGDMFELGAMEEEGHREVGRKIAAMEKVDVLYVLGKRAAWIAEAAERPGLTVIPCSEFEVLAEKLVHNTEKDDIILVKASRGMHFERVCELLTSM